MELQFMPQEGETIQTLYHIIKKINQDLDLDKTLFRILSCAAEVANVDCGSLFFGGEQGRFAQQVFFENGKIIEVGHPVQNLPLFEKLADQIKVKQTLIQVDNIQQNKIYATLVSGEITATSFIALPIVDKDHCLAVLMLVSHHPKTFNQAIVTLLQEVCVVAVQPILNAQLHESERRRRAMSSMMTEIARQMNTTVSMNEVFRLLLDPLKLVIDYDQCIVFMIGQGYLTAKVANGVTNFEEIDGVRVRLYKDDFAIPAIRNYEAIFTEDLQQHNTWFRDVTDTTSRSWICVPLLANSELLGIITIGRKIPKAYADEDLQLVSILAAQAAIALHNVSLLSQLSASESRYTNLFEESSDLLLIMNIDGVILDANRKACRMLRRPKDAIIGSDLALLGLNLREAFNDQQAQLSKGREATIELAIKDAYGQEIPLEITAKQVEIDEEVAVQWAGRDITARYELAKMRQDLTQMIVHDLRGPVGTLLGSVELLPFLIQGDATQESMSESLELLQIAVHTGKTLRDLVDSMLDLAKLEQGNFPLKLNAVHLPDLLKEVEYQVMPKAKPKRIELSVDKGKEGFTIDLDGSIIRRVLVNLTDNALKYTQSGGQVALTVSTTDQFITFKVIDNGPGIPEKHQQHIFDKFGRVDQHSNVQGVGLGLAFCKMAVEAHYGQIQLDTTIEVGSTFVIEIPLNLAERLSS